jgi:multicomponent Na+:H+ antiporter subunit E
MKAIVLFFFSFVMWLVLAWPFGEGQGFATGVLVQAAVVALVVALVMREMTTQRFSRWLNPMRIFWLLVYLCVMTYNIVRANFDVAYRVLHPGFAIKPGVVKVKTTLASASAITALANSITLTPGTHTIEALSDGTLYVHWLVVKTTDMDIASKMIVGRYEWVLRRIFE